MWNLGPGRKICIRSSIHSYVPPSDYAQPEVEGEEKPERTYQNNYALTEYEMNKVNNIYIKLINYIERMEIKLRHDDCLMLDQGCPG